LTITYIVLYVCIEPRCRLDGRGWNPSGGPDFPCPSRIPRG